ncbi:hypothetical protein CEUSTIGMA_g4491.t1 [Chlamydomonas eustigma]|uniref:Replication protein A subunit n=1 Tax=Chlamydomonas eustigma TaxID=1157962 RepID=A0A250X1S0_9CHLO|nr:hypothetical protein CEUSTIGMA_g4491.t1 [Chlamydomonas eustigma]|eukprot:GAX77044.1 hypothetical protein CEUSTIGMA_g4491.t1 [Chlamydomonas eustigma]
MLSVGSISKIKSGDCQEPIVLQITSLEKATNNKFKVTLSDGQSSNSGVLATQLSELVDKGDVKLGTIARLNAYVLNKVQDGYFIMTTDLEVVAQDENFVAPALSAAVTAVASTPNSNRVLKETSIQNTPGAMVSPGPAPSPSEDPRLAKSMKTHEGGTPSSLNAVHLSPTPSILKGFSPLSTPTGHQTPPVTPTLAAAGTPVQHVTQLAVASEKKNINLIQQLHPYQDSWNVKVVISRKSPLWTNKGPPKFVVEMADSQGGQIQGTFWRGQAERYHEVLQEGKVYVISKFQVKVANKAYNSCKNEYEIHFNDKTEVLEAPDQDTSGMAAVTFDIIPIEQLPKHVGRKVPVDVMGVVVALGPLGSVKRKSDNSDLQRRDVTLVDQSGKSVSLTLWGDLSTKEPAATCLEEHASRCVIMQVTNCRVTDYMGCSLSSVSKSLLTVDTQSAGSSNEAAEALKGWWKSQGYEGSAGLSFPSVGDSATVGGKGSGNNTGTRSFGYLSDINAAANAMSLPDPSARPVSTELTGCASVLKSDQTFYYLANPETGKKVTQQHDGSYMSEDGSMCAAPQHRYVYSFKLVDFTGETWANIFSAEGEAMLGVSADRLAEVKDQDADAAAALCKAAQWKEWSVVVSSKSREYNGERKMRHTVTSLKPVDYVQQCRRLLDTINKF